jgi:hypothetical protein
MFIFLELRSFILRIHFRGSRIFRKKLIFKVTSCYPHTKPKMEDHWLSLPANAYSIYSQLLSVYGCHLFHPEPEDAPCRGDKGPTWHGVFHMYINWEPSSIWNPVLRSAILAEVEQLQEFEMCSLQNGSWRCASSYWLAKKIKTYINRMMWDMKTEF